MMAELLETYVADWVVTVSSADKVTTVKEEAAIAVGIIATQVANRAVTLSRCKPAKKKITLLIDPVILLDIFTSDEFSLQGACANLPSKANNK